MSSFINGNDDVFLFKIIDTKYAQEFLHHGKLAFSCAKNYSELSKQGKPGQGDDEEGLFGRIKKDDTRLKHLESYYGENLLKETYVKDSNYVDLRLTHVSFMPIYCLFSLKVNDFTKNIKDPKPGINPATITISQEYFKDFRNSANKKSLILIDHGKEFIHRLTDKIVENGYNPIWSDVNYIERNKTFLYPPDYHPNELFCKDKSRFQDQKELRVIIKNKSLEKDKGNLMFINIGDLSDIAQQIDELPNDDLAIKARVILSKATNT